MGCAKSSHDAEHGPRALTGDAPRAGGLDTMDAHTRSIHSEQAQSAKPERNEAEKRTGRE